MERHRLKLRKSTVTFGPKPWGHMRIFPYTVPLLALLCFSCTKEDKPLLQATLHATCRDCVVSYAVGPEQTHVDTLHGIPVEGTTDTLAQVWQKSIEVIDGDNLFLRACRIRTDTAFGNISVNVDGGVRPLQAAADTAAECAGINQALHAQ